MKRLFHGSRAEQEFTRGFFARVYGTLSYIQYARKARVRLNFRARERGTAVNIRRGDWCLLAVRAPVDFFVRHPPRVLAMRRYICPLEVRSGG